ncbi:MAG: penicillin-binding protein activator [Candidatus Midichloria sp.]
MKKFLSCILMIGIMSFNTACDKINLSDNKKTGTAIRKNQHKSAVKHAQNARIAKKSSQYAQIKPDGNIVISPAKGIKSQATITPKTDLSGHFGSIRRGRELNIAVLLPLSGQYAGMGQSMLDAVQLASAELGSGKINMIAIDAGSTPESAANALSNIGNNIDAIIGPVLKGQMEIVNRHSRAKDIANIAFINDRDFVNLGNLLMLGMPIEQQMSRVISYAAQKGAKNIFTIIPNNSLGESIEALLLDYKNSNEIKDFITVKYNETRSVINTNFTQAVQELKNKMSALPNYFEDAIILLPQSGNFLRKVSQNFEMLRDPNLKKIKVICGSQFHDSGPYSITWSNNPWFADVGLAARADFAARFRATNKYDPHHMASLAYDAVALILAVIEHDNNNLLVFNPKTLLNKAGFEGINGVFRFTKDGSGERLLSIFKIDSNQVIEIDPALTSFE